MLIADTVLVVNYLIQDGKSNYLEGAMLLGMYVLSRRLVVISDLIGVLGISSLRSPSTSTRTMSKVTSFMLYQACSALGEVKSEPHQVDSASCFLQERYRREEGADGQ
jgi:hypothetical protein